MSIKTRLIKILKQKNTSPHIGAVINVYSATGILYSPLTLIGVATTLFGLWGREIITKWLPWFTFPMLIGCMVLFILIMMVVFYKVIIPSSIAFNMQQNYKHRNPLVKDIKEGLRNDKLILKEIRDMKTRIEELEKK